MTQGVLILIALISLFSQLTSNCPWLRDIFLLPVDFVDKIGKVHFIKSTNLIITINPDEFVQRFCWYFVSQVKRFVELTFWSPDLCWHQKVNPENYISITRRGIRQPPWYCTMFILSSSRWRKHPLRSRGLVVDNRICSLYSIWHVWRGGGGHSNVKGLSGSSKKESFSQLSTVRA